MRLSCLLVVSSLVIPSNARAQQITATYGISHSSHEVVRSLNGYAVHLVLGPKGMFSGGVGFRQYSGSHYRSGSLCGLSAFCSAELIRDQTKQSEVDVFGAVTFLRAAPRGASVEGRTLFGAQVVHVVSHSLGAGSGRESDTDRHMPGVSLGFDVSARRSATAPFGARFAIFWAAYANTGYDVVLTRPAFEGSVAALRAELGLTWFLPGATP